MKQENNNNKLTVQPIDYLVPDVPQKLPLFEVPLLKASSETLENYGELVDDYHDYPVEIVTWPSQGRRPVDSGTGNEAGTVSGTFDFWWEGDYLYGKNHAVNDQ